MGPHWKGTLPLQTSPVHTWFCTTVALKEEGQPRAEPALCPQSDGLPLTVSRRLLTASPCFRSSLKLVKCPPSTYRGVWGTVWGQCCWCFSPYFALVTKFLSSRLVWLGQWKGQGKWKEMAGLLSPFLRSGKPRRMVQTVSCSHTCVKEISLLPQHWGLQRQRCGWRLGLDSSERKKSWEMSID